MEGNYTVFTSKYNGMLINAIQYTPANDPNAPLPINTCVITSNDYLISTELKLGMPLVDAVEYAKSNFEPYVSPVSGSNDPVPNAFRLPDTDLILFFNGMRFNFNDPSPEAILEYIQITSGGNLVGV
jgi:hypothetical protein